VFNQQFFSATVTSDKDKKQQFIDKVNSNGSKTVKILKG